MTFTKNEIKQMLDNSGIHYSFDSNTPGVVYEDGTHQTFDQALKNFRQHIQKGKTHDSL